MATVLMQCSGCEKLFGDSDSFNGHDCEKNNSSAEAGYIEGPPIGPICTLLPNNFHQYVSQDILKSYLSCNVADAQTFTKLAGAANIPVITKKKNDTVYQHVMENLTEGGKRAVMEIQPWLFNTLIDWSKEFESYVCSDALPDVDQSRDQFTSDVQIKAPKTSLWSKVATHTLIDLHVKYQNMFQKPSIKKKEVWQKIANDMCKSSFEFTSSQCEQKWKNITKSYRDTVDHNRKSGNDKKKECAFFTELEDCLGYRPNVTPVFTLGSSTSSITSSTPSKESNHKSFDSAPDPKRQKTSLNKMNDHVVTLLNTTITSDEQELDTSSSSSPVCKRKSSTNDEIMRFLGSMKQDQTELINAIKEQHCDRMKNEKKKIDLMEKLVNALSKN